MADGDDIRPDLGRVDGRVVTASRRRQAVAGRGPRLRLRFADDPVESGASETVERVLPRGAQLVTPEQFQAEFGESDTERVMEHVEEGEEDRDMMEGAQTTGAQQTTQQTAGDVGARQTVEGDVHSSSSIVMVRRGRGGRFERLTEAEGSSSGRGSSSTPGARRGRDDTWRLSTAAPGGPEILDVIPSFGGHVAYSLYVDPLTDRGVMRAWTRGQGLTVLSSWIMSEDMRISVDGSGLAHLVHCVPQHLDMPLLTAFIERWQPDTNTFHMPFGEMTIMLHDVAEILMLPIEGRVCFGDVTDTTVDMMTLFSCTAAELRVAYEVGRPPLMKSGAVLCEALRRRLEGHATAERQAQAYLMYLIGSTLFVDKTGDRVRSTYFSLLRDVDRVSEYAWGAGTLAYLYRSLGVASRTDCRGVDGCLGLLQCWIYEHFPTLRPTQGMLVARDELPERHPRSTFWSSRGHRRVSDEIALRELRTTLDQMTAERVSWCPYGPLPFTQLPRTLFRGVIRFLDIMEPYHPDRCIRQLGFVQTIPLPIMRPDEQYRGRNSQSYKVKYVGRVHDDSWYSLAAHGLSLDGRFVYATPESLSAPGYMEWYLPRSHPWIIDPASLAPPLAVDRSHIVLAAGHRVLDTFRPFYDGMSLSEVYARCDTFIGEMGPVVYQYYGIQGAPQWPPVAAEEEEEPSSGTSRRRRGGPVPRGGGVVDSVGVDWVSFIWL